MIKNFILVGAEVHKKQQHKLMSLQYNGIANYEWPTIKALRLFASMMPKNNPKPKDFTLTREDMIRFLSDCVDNFGWPSDSQAFLDFSEYRFRTVNDVLVPLTMYVGNLDSYGTTKVMNFDTDHDTSRISMIPYTDKPKIRLLDTAIAATIAERVILITNDKGLPSDSRLNTKIFNISGKGKLDELIEFLYDENIAIRPEEPESEDQ